MLSFDIRSLEDQAVHVDGALAPDDAVWNEGDTRPSEPIRVTGRLSAAGPGRFYFHGRIEGEVVLPCRRCLVDASAHVEEESHLIFAEPDVEGADDPDVFPVDPRARELDIRPALRELWLLSAPAYALCREDCQGLCPRCGADLNQGACECPPAGDSRWEALRKLDGTT